MNKKEKYISPSKTYVMICDGPNFGSFFFKKFTLPENVNQNNAQFAEWYFFNVLDFFSCSSKGIVTFEDYQNLVEIE